MQAELARSGSVWICPMDNQFFDKAAALGEQAVASDARRKEAMELSRPHFPLRAPRTIKGRLLITGLALTGIALLAAALLIDAVLDGYVRRNFHQSLDVQVGLLARSVRPDGSVDRDMLQAIGPYTQYRRGWAWRIEAPRETVASTEQIGQLDFHEEGVRGREGHLLAPPETLKSGRAGNLYVRVLEKETPRGLVKITATAPYTVFERLRKAAIAPVLGTLAGLAILLMLSTLLQLNIGLRPLHRLKSSLADIRSGASSRVPDDQPAELQLLVTELNGLLDENAAALARARGHVANLAHSLKTPLATLSVKLNDIDRDPDGQLTDLVTQIDGAIRHHLGRARAASPGVMQAHSIPVAAIIDDLIAALGRIYADRSIAFEKHLEPDCTLKCDPQDLSEILGNLLDNAAKWAASQVMVTTETAGRMVRVAIEDDGPGLTLSAIDEALVPGRRLDEREEGHGFGLPIARELAELHGGSLEFGVSRLGGLCVLVLLPR